jgi:hypothetical protein
VPARDESVLREILPPEDRVIEAVVARYQRVAPAILRFARSLSGNDDLQVKLGSQASAGENEIVIDPGVFQAAYARAAPVTPTEVALTSALHEVVHLMATDFDEKRPIPADWIPEETPAPPAGGAEAIGDPISLFDSGTEDGAATERLEELDAELAELEALGVFEDAHTAGGVVDSEAQPTGTPVSLLDALREAGGGPGETLFFAVEDARQERRFFAEFHGARSVLADLYRAARRDAFREAPPLGQFALACFLMIGGYEERNELQRVVDGRVANALDEAIGITDEIAHTDDPWDVAGHALELLAVARRHRLVNEIEASDTKRIQDAKQEADQSAISESVDAVRMITPPLQDAASYEETRVAAQSVSAQEGRKGDAEQAGDPATDQLLKVGEAPTVYLPTGQGGKLVVADFPGRFARFSQDGRGLLEEAATRWGVAQRRVSGELYPLFLANQRRGLRSGFDAGDPSPYSALLLGAGLYERMFERRDLPTKRSYAVSLLVDGSASMLQPRPMEAGRRRPWALAAATLGAWTLARLADELQIEFEVALFNRAFAAAGDDTEQAFLDRQHAATGALRRSQGGAADRLTRTVNHYLVKSFDARWRAAEDVMAGLFWMAAAPVEASRAVRKDMAEAPPISMFEKAANVDEYNVAYAARRLADRRAATRILVVLADGMTRGSVAALADSVDSVEASGTVVLGIGIGDNTVEAAYSRNQVVERPEVLARAMVDGVRGTLFRTIAHMGGRTWWTATGDPFADHSMHPGVRRAAVSQTTTKRSVDA